jgi:hypothetical protein
MHGHMNVKNLIFSNFCFPRKSWRLWDNGRDGQATDNNIIRRMRFECWITKATYTHSEYVRTLPVLFKLVYENYCPIINITSDAL